MRTNIVICPSCGAENIEGVDTCENCLMDLRTIDVPETAQSESESALLDKIAGLRCTRPLTTGTAVSVREAVAVLARDPAGGLIVLDGARVAGIFTERDVLKKVAGRPETLDLPVTAFMTRDPVMLRPGDTIATALNKMGDGGFRHIPVAGEGRVHGVLTGRDVLAWVMSRYFE